MSGTALKSPVAALYVETGGVYFGLEGVDPWDEERDARLYDGPHPVVAHPPCARWSRLAGFTQARFGLKRGEDGGCFKAALEAVHRFGGVLEHPAYSDAWKVFHLPRPTVREGWTLGLDGGASCYVEQGRYGLPVKKATWLYAYGVELADLRWGFTSDANGDPENQTEHGGMDAWRDKFKGRSESWIAGAPNRGTVERDGDRRNRPSHLRLTSTTPPLFRDALIEMARTSWLAPVEVAAMELPPGARRLDVRATRAAFAAGTLGTVGDHPSGEDAERDAVARNADRHNTDDVQHEAKHGRSEAERQAWLRRVQHVDPRERRA